MNSGFTSFTMIIPSESGPKASSRVEKGTLPRCNVSSEFLKAVRRRGSK